MEALRAIPTCVLLALLALPTTADAEPEVQVADPGRPGRIAMLPAPTPHRVWVSDMLLAHSQLFDGDTGEALATIDAGVTISPKPPLHSARRGEFYSVEIDYARGRRGERIDYVTIYDDRSLEVVGEVVIPTRTSESATSIGYAALLDDQRFLATFNQFPQASVSVTDLEARRFVGEVAVAGCAGIYPVSGRRFLTLCGDGTVLRVGLDAEGRKAGAVASERFFDPVADPVMMAGARSGDRWLFTSFTGTLHEVDAGAAVPAVSSWPLVGEADAAAGWRPGGKQHLALHRELGRLYSVFHRGAPGTHKDPGPEVWVFDLARRERVDRLQMPNFTAAFLGQNLGVEAGGVADWLLQALLPGGGAHSVAVTQDPEPLLFTRNAELGVVAVLDARSGEHLRNLDEVGLAGNRLEVPE